MVRKLRLTRAIVLLLQSNTVSADVSREVHQVEEWIASSLFPQIISLLTWIHRKSYRLQLW